MGREKKGGEGRGGKRKEMGRGNIKDRLTRGARVEHRGKCRENGKREGEIKEKGNGRGQTKAPRDERPRASDAEGESTAAA